jgi:hypothetical protein
MAERTTFFLTTEEYYYDRINIYEAVQYIRHKSQEKETVLPIALPLLPLSVDYAVHVHHTQPYSF